MTQRWRIKAYCCVDDQSSPRSSSCGIMVHEKRAAQSSWFNLRLHWHFQKFVADGMTETLSEHCYLACNFPINGIRQPCL